MAINEEIEVVEPTSSMSVSGNPTDALVVVDEAFTNLVTESSDALVVIHTSDTIPVNSSGEEVQTLERTEDAAVVLEVLKGLKGDQGGTGPQGIPGEGKVNSVNGDEGPNVIITKSTVGLSNVDNTSDANKPISIAAAAALALKADDSAVVKLTGSQTIAGSKTFTGVTSLNGQANIDGGGQALTIRPGAADHAYLAFNARTAIPGTRHGYLGFTSAGSTTLTMVNESSGGLININTVGNGNIQINAGTGSISLTSGSVNATGILQEAGQRVYSPNNIPSASVFTSGTLPDARLPARLGIDTLQITDFNTAVQNGWYKVYDPTAVNAPSTGLGGDWLLHVISYTSTNLVQTTERLQSNGSTATVRYRRHLNGGVWSAWYRLSDSLAEQDLRYAQISNTVLLTGTQSIAGLKTFTDIVTINPTAATPATTTPRALTITPSGYATNTAGLAANIKLAMYDQGGNTYGFGISASRMEYQANQSGGKHTFYVSGTETLNVALAAVTATGTFNATVQVQENGQRVYSPNNIPSIATFTSGLINDAQLPTRLRANSSILADFNDAGTNGFYTANTGTLNPPVAGQWWYLTVETYVAAGSGEVMQTASELSGALGTYRRWRAGGGTWGAWEKLTVRLGDADIRYVMLTGAQTVAGIKTFSSAPVVPDASWTIAKTSGLQTALDLKAPLASPTFTGTVSGVTAAMVGLGNVNNTADSAKPVSTAQQTALDLKANLASPTFTGTVSGITKAMVGLSNVDNTGDSSKAFASSQITSGVLAVARLGSGTPTASTYLRGDGTWTTFPTIYTSLASLTDTVITTPVTGHFLRHNGTSWINAVPTKTDVGLANVDNTTDAAKPVSTATQTALNLKANLASPTFTGTVAGITASMVGLGNVANAAQVDLTTAQTIGGIKTFSVAPVVPDNSFTIAKTSGLQTALDAKAPLASPTFTGTVSGVTKAHVGLGSVDNTSDAAKPISTATQTALNLKANTSSLHTVATSGSYADLINKPTIPVTYSDLTGTLPTSALPPLAINEIYPVADQAAMLALSAQRGDMAIRLDGTGTFVLASDSPSTLADWKNISTPAAVTSVAGKIGAVTLVKADVGLGSVDNTTDAAKPVSTATQTALNLKANLASPTFTGTVSGITAAMVGLGSVNNTADSAKPISTATQTALDLKANINSPTFTGTVSGITAAMVGAATAAHNHDTVYVALTGAQTIAGIKTFSSAPVVPSNSWSIASTSGLQTALDTKAPLASPTFTGTVSGITSSMVGLGSVDNTSDANKPVSTATQTALNLKANLAGGAAFTGVITVGGQAVVVTNDSRLTDARTPTTHTHNQTMVIDARYVAGNPTNLPGYDITPDEIVDNTITAYFSQAYPGGAGAWRSALTVKGWSDGYAAWQIMGPSSNSTADDNFYMRSGLGGTWRAAVSLWHSGNFDPTTKAATIHGHALTDANITGVLPIAQVPTGTTGTTVALGNHLHTGVYEPAFAAGTTAQFYRGDKTWQTLNVAAVSGAAPLASPTFTGTVNGVTAAMVGLGNVTNSAQVDLSSAQTISGAKTFTGGVTLGAGPTAGLFLGGFVSLSRVGSSEGTVLGNNAKAGTANSTLQRMSGTAGTGDPGTYLQMRFDRGLEYGVIPNSQAANVDVADTTGRVFTVSLAGNMTLSGSATIGGNLTVPGASYQTFSAAGVAPPTFTTRSAGTKIVLWDAVTASSADYAIGIDASTLWYSVPSAVVGSTFKWYGGTTLAATLTGTGNMTLVGSATATSFIGSGASLTSLTAANISGVIPIANIPTGTTGTTVALGNHLHTGVYEPVITTGTTAQYLRGDKTWQILDATAVGLGNVPNVDMRNLSSATSGTVADARLPARIGNRGNTNSFGGDWNLARQPGWYSSDTSTNSPGSGWWLVTVETHDDSVGNLWVTQTAHQFNAGDGASDTKMWRRSCEAGVWQAWYRLRWAEAELDTRYLNASNMNAGTVPQARMVQNIQRVYYTGSAPARPTGSTYVEWVGPNAPTGMVAGDTWITVA